MSGREEESVSDESNVSGEGELIEEEELEEKDFDEEPPKQEPIEGEEQLSKRMIKQEIRRRLMLNPNLRIDSKMNEKFKPLEELKTKAELQIVLENLILQETKRKSSILIEAFLSGTSKFLNTFYKDQDNKTIIQNIADDEEFKQLTIETILQSPLGYILNNNIVGIASGYYSVISKHIRQVK